MNELEPISYLAQPIVKTNGHEGSPKDKIMSKKNKKNVIGFPDAAGNIPAAPSAQEIISQALIPVLPKLSAEEKLVIRELQLAFTKVEDEFRALQTKARQVDTKFMATLEGLFKTHNVDPSLFQLHKETLEFEMKSTADPAPAPQA